MEYFDLTNHMDLMKFVPTIHGDTYPFIDPKNVDLSGKSVFITGASRGFGLSIAKAFAAAGCSHIAVGARGDLSGAVEGIKASASNAGRTEPTVLPIKMDVSSEVDVSSAVEAVAKTFNGKLDVLINNAGYTDAWALTADNHPTDWWRVWEVQVKGVYLCCHFFLPLLLQSESKTILNTTSGATIGLSGGAAAYGSSKMAVNRFTEYLHQEYARKGLIAIALEPGSSKTDLADRLHQDFHPYLTDRPELVANTSVWLVAERREWLSARLVPVKMDMEELSKKKDEIVEKNLLRFRISI